MNARELYQAGKLNEAVRTLSADLRDNPADAQRRTFLFELLCFAGEYDRAEKQLDALSQLGRDTELGTLLYRVALQAERTRQEMFAKKQSASGEEGPLASNPLSGTLNGKSFHSFADADPRLGSRLEVIAAGAYMWIPFHQIASIQMEAPKRLRDLLWTPAVVRGRNAASDRDLGKVLIPAIAPLSWKHADDAVRLGRMTCWEEDASAGTVPVGQKMFLVDGEDFPFLEMRQLEFCA